MEFLMGSFVKSSLIVLTKVLLFSIPSITLPRIDCPYHKAKQHDFFDGRAPLLTGGEADFGNRAPQINWCFRIRKVVRYHGFIGEENTSPITNWTLSHIQSKFIMFSPLFCNHCWCYKSVNVGFKPDSDIRFLINHLLCWGKLPFFIVIIGQFVVLLIVLGWSNHLTALKSCRLRPPRFVLYSVLAVITLHGVVLCTPQILAIAKMYMPFSNKLLMVSHVSLLKYVNLRWLSIVSYNTR